MMNFRKGGHFMPDYKEMYVKLFQSQTMAIGMMQEVQRETEAMFIEVEPANIRLLDFKRKDEGVNDAKGAEDE